MSETMELLPDPVRMVEGLRDTGYQFNTAVADVVDNSIAAKATHIEVSDVYKRQDWFLCNDSMMP